MSKRIDQLLASLSVLHAEAMLLHSPENMRYFSGYTGEGCIFVSAAALVILTDSRYTEQAKKQAPSFAVEELAIGGFAPSVAELCRKHGVTGLGFEDDILAFTQYQKFAETLASTKMVPVADLCVKIRAIKDAGEIKLLRKACELTDLAFQHFLTILKPGVSEIEISTELKYYMAKTHHVQPSFEFIVASGENGSMPHAIASERLIRQGDMVTLDFGAEYYGYHADMTRTVAVGKPSDRMLEVYQIVMEAQAKAAQALGPGVECRAVDSVARDLIRERGYGSNFGHGLGHGVGLQIHELPGLSAKSDMMLQPGMAVTVEPGIYLPGIGGVRIEDTCLITESGWESLFVSEKSLIIL